MAEMPEIYGREATDAGLVLGKMFESDPDLFVQYMESLKSIDPGRTPDIDYKEAAINTLDRLANEDILIYLADSLKGSGKEPTGLYRRTFFGGPDTAFVAKHAYGEKVSPREMVNTSLHEALLHGTGMKHLKKENPIIGKTGSSLLDLIAPGWLTPTDRQVSKSSQWAYNIEEAELEDVMRSKRPLLPYAEHDYNNLPSLYLHYAKSLLGEGTPSNEPLYFPTGYQE